MIRPPLIRIVAAAAGLIWIVGLVASVSALVLGLAALMGWFLPDLLEILAWLSTGRG